jgi:hypothetical protein
MRGVVGVITASFEGRALTPVGYMGCSPFRQPPSFGWHRIVTVLRCRRP